MDYTVPDTLVFKIIENVDDDTDTHLYLLFDHSLNTYVIRGKRIGFNAKTGLSSMSNSYSFECDCEIDLINFIEFVVDPNDYNLSYTLYNYTNLPLLSNDITYEFLETSQTAMNEIVGYDDVSLNRKRLTMIFNLLKNVYNCNN